MGDLFNLQGKTAWITGGKRIGQRVAEALAEHGANLILSYNNSKKEAEEIQKRVRKFGVKTLVVKVDVASRESVINAVARIKTEFKKLDILILMASIFNKVELGSITEKEFKNNFYVHVLGTFWPVQLSLDLMPRGSSIITISDRTSIGSIYEGYLPYVVTKGAVAHLTRVLALDLGPKGIFVNSIAPGPILKSKGLTNAYWNEIRKNSIVDYQIDDRQAVEEFAKLVLYLSTVKSTGSIYSLDLGHL